jgi:hypothetical protein
MLQLIINSRNKSKHFLLIKMNKIIASVFGNKTLSIFKRFIIIKEEVVIIKSKVIKLKEVNADLRKET